MANKQNLRPRPTFTSGAEAQRFGKKGGSVKSKKKKLAAAIRELKQKATGDEFSKYVYDLLNDRDLSILDILLYTLEFEDQCKTVKEKIAYARLRLEIHRLHFGKPPPMTPGRQKDVRKKAKLAIKRAKEVLKSEGLTGEKSAKNRHV